MGLRLRPMITADYDGAFALWQRTTGMGISEADSLESITLFLERNPGFSWVAVEGEQIVGTILVGSDGRRGYLYHLAVEANHRRHGIGRSLLAKALDGLKARGMTKCHLFVIRDNELGQEFWRTQGWVQRQDVLLFSKDL